MVPLFVLALAGGPTYLQTEVRWRVEKERALLTDTGWLSVAGLVWLGDRLSTVGLGPGYDVRLSGKRSELLGTATLADGKVWFQPEPNAGVIVDGRISTGIVELRADDDPRVSTVLVGTQRMQVIRRDKRVGFRIFDPFNARRMAFKGLRWYPVDPKWRIEARFVRYAKPRTIPIVNVLGDTRMAPCPGYAEFKVGGRTVRLLAEDQGETYFFNFGDRTNNRTTYGAGRFLHAAKPKGGAITLDFNRAVNPPCAFTDFATCPLPPRANVLTVAIPAGALNGHPR